MQIIWTIVIGFVVGLLAKLVMPGREPSGFFVTAAIGIIGSLIATFAGKAIGIYQGNQSAGFFGAFIGAIILLILYRMFVRKQ
jgi:uncharacterized membrane protein YeaQ/YmgE (transglycosylase-associated protein family)